MPAPSIRNSSRACPGSSGVTGAGDGKTLAIIPYPRAAAARAVISRRMAGAVAPGLQNPGGGSSAAGIFRALPRFDRPATSNTVRTNQFQVAQFMIISTASLRHVHRRGRQPGMACCARRQASFRRNRGGLRSRSVQCLVARPQSRRECRRKRNRQQCRGRRAMRQHPPPPLQVLQSWPPFAVGQLWFRLAPGSVVDLDSALAQLGLAEQPVNILKIDVEGYEPAVIAGATKTLERTAAVILEYSPDLSRAGGSVRP